MSKRNYKSCCATPVWNTADMSHKHANIIFLIRSHFLKCYWFKCGYTVWLMVQTKLKSALAGHPDASSVASCDFWTRTFVSHSLTTECLSFSLMPLEMYVDSLGANALLVRAASSQGGTKTYTKPTWAWNSIALFGNSARVFSSLNLTVPTEHPELLRCFLNGCETFV